MGSVRWGGGSWEIVRCDHVVTRLDEDNDLHVLQKTR